MKIAVRGGHNFLATGAKALIDEVLEDRKVKDALIKYLKQLGHEVLDVTPGNMDTDNDLMYGVSKANSWGADIFISIHFNKAYNSYNGAIGTETWVYSKTDNIKLDEEVAGRIVDRIGALGFVNRGIKERTDLYELKATKMASVIVEVCFVEATEDVNLYKRLGPDRIGQTIAEAIANKKVEVSKFPLPLKMVSDAMSYDGEVKIFNKGDLLTADAENQWAYAIELDGKRCWVEKANVKLLGITDERYRRFRLQVTEYPCRVWAKEIKPFYKDELITARFEMSGYYALDIDGARAYIRKNVTMNR
ncbi:MAG: N-acetylmuramoyl-L-alanine amidase [Clostridium sp.]|uniref:N-acetylmuramoyl-L-alanine amidase n=1 Tax=Clostridium sp. TaxID=1506 RepID=UPI001EB4FA36|nr:N-acetylmuramoyl-L-alanine amidase [Clostridium sp.]MBS5884847.1 N-acetylmuramoyl-L-alanine amidase [Clostridium sp.]MDU7148342.1 N-acetylmuramoyl-L-alanine amidase [Clostridium sp.]